MSLSDRFASASPVSRATRTTNSRCEGVSVGSARYSARMRSVECGNSGIRACVRLATCPTVTFVYTLALRTVLRGARVAMQLADLVGDAPAETIYRLPRDAAASRCVGHDTRIMRRLDYLGAIPCSAGAPTRVRCSPGSSRPRGARWCRSAAGDSRALAVLGVSASASASVSHRLRSIQNVNVAPSSGSHYMERSSVYGGRRSRSRLVGAAVKEPCSSGYPQPQRSTWHRICR